MTTKWQQKKWQQNGNNIIVFHLLFYVYLNFREEVMPKKRRGCGGTRRDLWTLAGGEDRVLHSFIGIGILPNTIPSSSKVWSRLASKVFGQDNPKNRKWLHTIWTHNRKGIKSRVEAIHERDSEHAQANKTDENETQTGTESEKVKEQLLIEKERNDDTAKQGMDSEDDTGMEQVDNIEIKTCIGTESEEDEDNYSEVDQGESKTEQITQTGTDFKEEEEDDSEIKTFVNTNEDRQAQNQKKSDSDGEQLEKQTVKVKQRGMESEEDEDLEVEQGKDDEDTERTIHSVESTMNVKDTTRYRKIPPVTSKFNITLTKDQWLLIAPKNGN